VTWKGDWQGHHDARMKSLKQNNLREKYERPEDRKKGYDFSKYKVKYVGDEVLHDYAGMNHRAGKAMGFKDCKKDEILIDKNFHGKKRAETIRHELVEVEEMRKGKDYFPAHKIALREEKKV
jgi:hypothetical protein